MTVVSVRVGIKDGVLTVVNEQDGTSVSIPHPPPPPKDGYGSWQPQVMERFGDGTALALWRWEVHPIPGTALWLRADRPPHLNVPPHTQLLEDTRYRRALAHLDDVFREREEWDGGVQERR